MKRILFLLILSTIFFVPCLAQADIFCPIITVTTLNRIYVPEDLINLAVASTDEKLGELKLEYKWKISKGVIEKGQGTSDILISTVGVENAEIFATVKIKGLPQNCPNIFPKMLYIKERPKPTLTGYHEKFDLSDPNEMMARIDSLYRALFNASTARGAIITYGTKKGILRREAAIKRFIKLLKYDVKLIEFIRAIRPDKARNQFFLVPQGEKLPVPEP